MGYIFDNERPIYLQLVKMLRIEIISGKYELGERLPSVREFAMITKVNPNTMQKALMELEKEKLICTERTNGKFITKDEKLIKKFKSSIAKEKIDTFLSDMDNIGINIDEITSYLQEKSRRK